MMPAFFELLRSTHRLDDIAEAKLGLCTGDNDQFIRYASDFRASADGALTIPPANCAAAEAALSRLGKACENCHRDYKN